MQNQVEHDVMNSRVWQRLVLICGKPTGSANAPDQIIWLEEKITNSNVLNRSALSWFLRVLAFWWRLRWVITRNKLVLMVSIGFGNAGKIDQYIAYWVVATIDISIQEYGTFQYSHVRTPQVRLNHALMGDGMCVSGTVCWSFFRWMVVDGFWLSSCPSCRFFFSKTFSLFYCSFTCLVCIRWVW